MRAAPCLVIACFCWAAALAQAAAPRPLRFIEGDDIRWAQPETEDTHWSPVQPRTAGNWWIRAHLDIGRGCEPSRPGEWGRLLRVYALGAVEVYWDGVLIGRNGRVGHSARDEIPGTISSTLEVSCGLATPGDHVVAVRVSSHHADRIPGFTGISLLAEPAGPWRMGRPIFFMSFTGLLVFAAIVFLLLYPSERQASTALFGLLCLLVATLLVLEFSRDFYDYVYPMHLRRLWLISAVSLMIGLLLPAFLMVRLDLPRRRWILITTGVVLVLLFSFQSNYDRHVLQTMHLSTALAFGLSLWGVRRGCRGRWFAVAAAGACFFPTLFSGMRYADTYFFLGFVLMTLILLVQMVLAVARERRERQDAILRSTTLRHELLRKQIQPHFLMNSLTAAIMWMEENPARGLQTLRALASELETFFSVAEEKLIPVAREAELCGLHVATMSHLLDRELSLETEGLADTISIPPGVLLTLVENALTHGRYTDTRRTISIRCGGSGDRVVLTVTNPAPDRAGAARDGTGFRYVRARLEEAYPGASSLTTHRENGTWIATLEFPRQAWPGPAG